MTNYQIGIQDIADKLGVHRMTVRNWMKRGIIPYIQIGDVIRFNHDEVLAALEKYRKNVPAIADKPADQDL